jgi:hypothetical protein
MFSWFCKTAQLLAPSYLVYFLQFRKLSDIFFVMYSYLVSIILVSLMKLLHFSLENMIWAFLMNVTLGKNVVFITSLLRTHKAPYHSRIQLLLKPASNVAVCFQVWAVANNGMSLFPFDCHYTSPETQRTLPLSCIAWQMMASSLHNYYKNIATLTLELKTLVTMWADSQKNEKWKKLGCCWGLLAEG